MLYWNGGNLCESRPRETRGCENEKSLFCVLAAVSITFFFALTAWSGSKVKSIDPALEQEPIYWYEQGVRTNDSIPGDLDNSGTVDLGDAVLGLRILTGISSGNVFSGADVSGDGRIGTEEIVYILHKVSGFRAHGEEPMPIIGWWESDWSEDGANLVVRYVEGNATYSDNIDITKTYNPYGTLVEKKEVRHMEGEDVCGRQKDVTIERLNMWRGSRIKPDSITCEGTFVYPVGEELGRGLAVRMLDVAVNYTYDGNGRLSGGSGHEEILGHVTTSRGRIFYSGTATGAFMVKDGQLLCTQRIEQTGYFSDSEPYAEVQIVSTPEFQYLGGSWVIASDTQNITTTYADGSQRESEITIVWERNANGIPTHKNGSGVATGTEIVNGKEVHYTASTNIDYGFHTSYLHSYGWIKAGYSEQRSAESPLPKRLPFEIISVDDPDFGPLSLTQICGLRWPDVDMVKNQAEKESMIMTLPAILNPICMWLAKPQEDHEPHASTAFLKKRAGVFCFE